MSRLRWLVLLLGSLSGLFSSGAANGEDIQKITSVEGISEYRLKNGMKVLLFSDRSKPEVTVNITFFVGSRHEGYGETGMAHLLEHMLFKGTPTHKNVPKSLQDRGARFNGTTWLDRTNYYETLPAEGDNLEFALKLEADRMMHSTVKASDLATEMTVVRSEFERGENSPRNILDQRMMSAAYEWHNYGKSTIGNRADIERVPIQNLRAFYHKFYQPDNAMLVVAGKFEEKKTLLLIDKYFGSIPRPKRKLPKTYTEEPAQDGERLVTLRRVGDVSVAGVLYHIPSGPHPDYAAIDVLESILTAAPSGRLYKTLVETKKSTRVSGVAYALHDPGVLQILAEVTKGNDPHAVLKILLNEVGRVAKDGVKPNEVERAKRRLLKQWQLNFANSRSVAIGLTEWAAQGDWRLYFLYRDRVEKVKTADVNRAAATYLKRNNRTVGLFLPTNSPQRAAIPATPNLTRMIGKYRGRKLTTTGEEFDISPANIEARTKKETLASGVQVVTLSKRNRGQSVVLAITLRYGNKKNLTGLTTAASLLPNLMRRGTKKLSRQALADQLDKNQVRLSASGSLGSITFSVQTKRKNLPAAVEILRQVLREPTLSAKELALLKNAAVNSIESSRKNPQTLAVMRIRRLLDQYPKNDPRYIPTLDEAVARIKAVTPSQMRRLYGEFLGSQHATLTIVGDFDAVKTVNRISEFLSGWEAKQPYTRISRSSSSNAKGSAKDILTPGKANAFYIAAMTFPVRDDDSDYPALILGNYILGGGSLASRLGTRVRQKEGLSYTIASMLRASAADRRTAFYIFAISNPKNTPKVKSAIRQEVEKLIKSGVTASELADAKKGYLSSYRNARGQDSRLLSILQTNTLVNRNMRFQAAYEKKITNVTAADILRVVKKYIRWQRLHITTAGDFQKKKTKRKPKTNQKSQ